MKRVLAFRRRLGEKIRGGGDVEEVDEIVEGPNDELGDDGTNGAGNTEGNGDANDSSLYQYAMYEYSQTVQPGQEETFRNRYEGERGPYNSYQTGQPPAYAPPLVPSPQPCEVNDDVLPESAVHNRATPELTDSTRTVVHGQAEPSSPTTAAAAKPPREVLSNPLQNAAAAATATPESFTRRVPQRSEEGRSPGVSTPAPPTPPIPSNLRHRSMPETISPHKSMSSSFDDYDSHTFSSRKSVDAEPEMPDATYEEYYGDAYVGGPIKYIYPSGYQYMRPRGFPWKLSMAVCAIFTWLSIFIVGHCSDRADMSRYENNYNKDNAEESNDDEEEMTEEEMLEMRWCGSRPLYFMWVLSVSITGVATAYCSIIGYIKVRDFAVANCRSQPPGMVGKSDYYVRIDDAPPDASGHYRKTIYQADGTPQFWGGHIYRPTQAAVAVTSR